MGFGGLNWTTVAQAKGQDKSLLLNLLSTDYDFLDVMDVNFREGRNFSRDTQADSSAIILNQTAAKQLGVKISLVARSLQEATHTQ